MRKRRNKKGRKLKGRSRTLTTLTATKTTLLHVG